MATNLDPALLSDRARLLDRVLNEEREFQHIDHLMRCTDPHCPTCNVKEES